MNVFLQDYYTRLRLWSDLRQKLETADLETICVEVDRFWQQAPLSAHYLHPDDVEEWPTPWELINDNNFCLYARALGMIYTLMLLGIKNVDLVEALDDNHVEVVLVLIDDAKYVMNYWPNSVVNTKSEVFTIKNHIDLEKIQKKIGIS
jgi:hypothetical protein